MIMEGGEKIYSWLFNNNNNKKGQKLQISIQPSGLIDNKKSRL